MLNPIETVSYIGNVFRIVCVFKPRTYTEVYQKKNNKR